MKTQQYIQTVQKHQKFLKKFNRFPEKTRKATYVQLLALPLNHLHLTQLTKQFPLIPQHTLDQQVTYIVGVITKLYPDLAIQWLPGMIFPFVRLFKQDAIASLEISLTFLFSWFKPLFSDYPNPPKQIMKWFGTNLPKLEDKINQIGYPLSSIIMPSIIVSLTDIVKKQQWLQICDFMVTHPFRPWYWICFILAIMQQFQEKLLIIEKIEQLAITLRKQKKLNLPNIFEKTKKIAKENEQFLRGLYQNNEFPIPKGRYPIAKFIKTKEPRNQLLQRIEETHIEQLNQRLLQLKGFIDKRSIVDKVINSKDIDQKYEAVEGQMREYLNKVRQEHLRKVQAIKQIQRRFKQQLVIQGELKNDLGRQAIERRGRLERQIQNTRNQANKLREMQLCLVKRIQDSTKIKKKQLINVNEMLKQERSNYY